MASPRSSRDWRRHGRDHLCREHGRDGGDAIYSTLVFLVAACVALLLGFSPKFGALILTLPGPVIGGLSVVVFGLIAATAGRIWVENRVDFSDPRNLVTAAAALVAGAGDLTVKLGGFTLGGIGSRRRSARSCSIICSAPRRKRSGKFPWRRHGIWSPNGRHSRA